MTLRIMWRWNVMWRWGAELPGHPYYVGGLFLGPLTIDLFFHGKDY